VVAVDADRDLFGVLPKLKILYLTFPKPLPPMNQAISPFSLNGQALEMTPGLIM
jgi:hypothetical protein